jgi:mono/diheme cytochrome c family protein
MKPSCFRMISLVAIAALAMASTGSGASAPGENLVERSCGQCHAVKANQRSANPSAPPFPEHAAHSSVTPYSLRVLLRSPHASMPNLMLNPEEMDEITGYILSLKPKP